MTSTQRYLANNRNALVGAVLTASSVASIENAVLEKPLARSGSARIALSGTYTGYEEAQYEIEIVDTSVEIPLISQPVLSGAGSGSISGIAYTGTAQEFTVSLADLGQVLTSAGTDIEGVSIVARNPGSAGNLIHLSVDQSGLVFVNSDFSTIQPIKIGADGEEGPQFDWDTKIMGADGQIPSDAHRLAFGEDTSTVYRQYKVYTGGKWLYHFEPAIKNEIQAGTRIKFVTGGRSVTLTDGPIIETYPGIVSLYDLLSAIQTASSLVKVAGVVANDRAPGGMAARDLVTRTDAHCLPSYGRGSVSAVNLVNCTVQPTAYTELVEARCWAVTSKDNPGAGVGSELWQVNGSVSGVIATALQTGNTLTTDRFAFAIPSRLPDGYGTQRGRFSQTGISYVTRNTMGGEIEPPICIKSSLAIGPEAIDQTITLTYQQRPNNTDCACETMHVPDLTGRECLTGKINITTEGGNIMTPPHMGRLSRIGAWHRDAVAANTIIGADGELDTSIFDVELIGKARDAFSSCLDDIYSSGTLAWPSWSSSTITARYTIIQVDDFRLMAQGDGTTGAVEPTVPVPSTPGSTVVDGSVTWELLGPTPEIMWDDALAVLKADLQVLFGVSTMTSIIVPGTPATYPGINLLTVTAGQVIASGTQVTNGAISVTLDAQLTVGQVLPVITLPSGFLIGTSCTVDAVGAHVSATSASGGTDSYTQTTTTGSGQDIDDDHAGAQLNGRSYTPALYASRYTSSMDAVRAAAGIVKKADASSKSGDGCWRDNGDTYWWSVTGSVGGDYAPAFSNSPYISCRQACGGAYFSTREFAFQVNVKCPEALKVGDTITLAMGDSGWPSTYQVGDVLYLPVIAAQDLYLAGGNDGDNVQTWHIDGSVDGPFPAYLNDLDLPTPYSANGLQFQINAGGIPFEAGDLYKFSVEGGHWRWRKDAGAWSLPSPVSGVGDALSDGLSEFFTTGAAPSFVAGDLYRFRALQPSSLSNVVSPDTDAWRWSGAGATLTANLGAVRLIDCAALAFHTLPVGAVVTISGGSDGVIWDWAESIPWRLGTMAMLWTARTATWLKIDIANANGGAIGWAWAGEALSTEFSAECQLRRDYAVERGAGLNPSAAFMGITRSGSIEWTEASLSDADMTKLLDLLDHLKSDDDAPMILIPHRLRPEDAWPVRVVMDEVDYQEVWNNQPNDGSARRYSMKLPVKGVMA